MSQPRILFMGTGIFALPTLERLNRDGLVVAVVTRPDRPRGRGLRVIPTAVKVRAQELHLPLMEPPSLKPGEVFEQLAAFQPDLIVSADYGALIPSRFLSLPPLGCINLHPSLLPMYRGASPVEGAIMAGETRTGITTFYMNEQWDQGDIILQREVEIGPNETGGQLRERLAGLGAELVKQTVALIGKGEAPRIPQDPTAGCYVRALKKEDLVIDWSLPAGKIHNQVRALAPRPGAATAFRGAMLKILETRPWSDAAPPGITASSSRPGEILDCVSERGLLVATGSTPLLVSSLLPAGKAPMSGWAYVLGHHPRPGEVLGGPGVT